MADIEVDLAELPTASTLSGGEFLPMKQGAGAVKVTAERLVRDILSLDPAAARALLALANHELVSVDTSGNVGIGTSSPKKNSGLGTVLTINGSPGTNGGAIELTNGENPAAYFFTDGSSAIFGTQTAIPLVLRTDNVERARIDLSGNLLVNTATATPGNANASVLLGGSTAGSIHLYRFGPSDMMRFIVAGVQSGGISSTSTATSYNTSSDYRLKDEEGEISDEDALAFIEASRPIWFNWKATGERVDGYLAHEVQQLIPWAVTGEKDAVEEIGDATGYRETDPETGVPIITSKETLTGITRAEAPDGYEWVKTGERPVYQGIDQSKLVPRLNAGLKAALRLIRAQETTIDALEARIAALEAAAQ